MNSSFIETLKQLNFITKSGQVNKNVYKLIKKHPEVYQSLILETAFLYQKADVVERTFCLINNIHVQQKCLHCKTAPVTFRKNVKKYSTFCSRDCINASSVPKNTRKKTLITLYGIDNVMKISSFGEKKKRTVLSKYGTEFASQNETVKKKILNTKSQWTDHEKQIIKNKKEQTSLNNFGTPHPMKCEKIKSKVRDTNLQKYGTECSLGNKKIRQKGARTMVERYGCEYSGQNKQLLYKANETKQLKYGTTNTSSLDWVKEKIRSTNTKKYGQSFKHQAHLSQITLYTLSSKDTLENLHRTEKLTQKGIAHLIGVAPSTIQRKFKIHGIKTLCFYSSQEEQQIGAFLQNELKLNIETNVRSIIRGELDIVISSHNIAIEHHGIYRHGEMQGKNRLYHLNKHIRCQEKGIQLIQIWQNEWLSKQEIVKSRLCVILGQTPRIIHARKCHVHYISMFDKMSFLNDTHLQGNAISSTNIGLVYNDELVAIMTFSKARMRKDTEYEMVRFSTAKYTQVVGGASKLFSFFVKHHNPQSVVSYSDVRWNTGHLYDKLGFTFSHTSKPNYFYFHKSTSLFLQSRIQFQKHKLQTKLQTFDPQLTEWENMVDNGYDRIWDCGNDVWLWSRT